MVNNQKSSDNKESKKRTGENLPASEIEDIIRQIDTRNEALKKIYAFFEKNKDKKEK
jgi:hypothetical protein